MLYEIRALTADNRIQSVVLDAQDEAAARLAANELALRPLTIRRSTTARFLRTRGRFSLDVFSQELLTLLEAGLSIVEGLESLEEKSPPGPARDIAAQLTRSLRQGKRLSQALGALPEYFPPLYIGIVQAAETTSDLPGALARYADFEQRLGQVRSKAISAAIYPSILLIVGGGVTLFLLGYVVPRFAQVYEESGRSMSWLTSMMMSWGRFIAGNSQWLLAALACSLLVAVAAWHYSKDRVSASDLVRLIPGVRSQVRLFELSRLYMTVGLLLQGGIPLVRALQLVEATVGVDVRRRLRRAVPRISAGESFSSALQSEELASDVPLRLFRVGERAGTLGPMLTKAARYYDTEVGQFIDRFTRTAEPVLMAAIGIVVGGIVVLLYMPIFELAGSLQ